MAQHKTNVYNFIDDTVKKHFIPLYIMYIYNVSFTGWSSLKIHLENSKMLLVMALTTWRQLLMPKSWKYRIYHSLLPKKKSIIKWTYSKTLFPPDEDKQYVPVCVYGEGNCAYRSMSLHVFGTEKYFTEMRVRAIIELALQKDFYLNEAMDDHKGRKFSSRLSQTTSSGSIHCLNDAFENKVLQTCQKNSWTGIWQISAFASIYIRTSC